eukprot:CAMPEP_0182529992 /NCGR_PEP_ID=MMETSP1323-20130603/5585_1 /TAXON_ID=236787 /ORGANISM="Florenciella parvula, Strain RCC1693" /LENGTH=247 /DNA_ID=CAMNT_0024739251 /DNA_START=66 /DNA_END=809 /DNA_ORIENTATION=-
MSEQRSGSTWFKEMLNGHPCMFMYGEMFMRQEKRKRFSTMLESPQKFMAKIPDTKPATCRYWVVGMKAFHYTTPVPTTLNPRNKELTPRVMQWMKKQGSYARFIHMERHNFLDRHLSDVRANSPGLGGHCQKIKGCDTSKVHDMRWDLKVNEMMKYLKEAEKQSASVKSMMSSSGQPVLSIKYDELRTKQEVWCQVLNFLGVSCADLVLLHSSLKKDITKGRDHVIRNYDEVEKALKGSQFEWMLES